MLQKVLARVRRAVADYNMIQGGDKIAVGVSGGKDSQLLLVAMRELQRFLPEKYELMAVTVDLGFKQFDKKRLLDFYKSTGIEYHIEETNISQVVFNVRDEKNPCALCANLKRGTIYNVARRFGCNKVAFAHHMDDVVETLLMSQIYEGRIHTFSPVTFLDRKQITLIRPLIYTEEKMVQAAVQDLSLLPVSSGCPQDGISKRQDIKELIRDLSNENRNVKSNLFGAIKRSGNLGW